MCNLYIIKTDRSLARTQIYLTQTQQQRLANASRRTGSTKSELIRRAVDQFLDAQSVSAVGAKAERLQSIRGLWSDHPDMTDPTAHVRTLRKPRF